MFVALFVAAMAFVIAFHEFGHFATAKAFGMKAERFFLGFGPTVWSFRRGETEYGVKALPLGGFVKIAGMSEAEEIDEADADRAFYDQPAWQRLIVLVAGSVTHFLVAIVVLFAGLALLQVPSDGPATNVVERVTADSPAAAAGLEPGDEIVSVAGEPTDDFEAVASAVEPRGGETVEITVLGEQGRATVQASLAQQAPSGERQGFLGVAPEAPTEQLSLGSAAAETFTGELSVIRLSELTLSGIADVFTPTGVGQIVSEIGSEGPRELQGGSGASSLIGAGQAFAAVGQSGDTFALIVLLVSLNIVLGVLNLAPLPPLDGGHVAVVVVESGVNGVRRLAGRAPSWRLNPSVLTPITLAVVLFLVALQAGLIYLDLTKPLGEVLQ
jgi:membrane-associated protease RseP (regulator of RpoE activity)